MIALVLRSAFVACILISCQSVVAQTKSPTVLPKNVAVRSSLSDPASEKKIEALLQKMTLEEKVGQLVQYSAGQPTGPGTGRTDYDDMIRKGEVGALFNITTARRSMPTSASLSNSPGCTYLFSLAWTSFTGSEQNFLFHWGWLPVGIQI